MKEKQDIERDIDLMVDDWTAYVKNNATRDGEYDDRVGVAISAINHAAYFAKKILGVHTARDKESST